MLPMAFAAPLAVSLQLTMLSGKVVSPGVISVLPTALGGWLAWLGVVSLRLAMLSGKVTGPGVVFVLLMAHAAQLAFLLFLARRSIKAMSPGGVSGLLMALAAQLAVSLLFTRRSSKATFARGRVRAAHGACCPPGYLPAIYIHKAFKQGDVAGRCIRAARGARKLVGSAGTRSGTVHTSGCLALAAGESRRHRSHTLRAPCPYGRMSPPSA